MNRNDIVKSIANDTKIPQHVVDKVLRSFVDTIALAMSCDEDVVISGFGKFVKKSLREAVLKDPRTGEDIPVAARTSISFKPSDVLKERLNGKRNEA